MYEDVPLEERICRVESRANSYLNKTRKNILEGLISITL